MLGETERFYQFIWRAATTTRPNYQPILMPGAYRTIDDFLDEPTFIEWIIHPTPEVTTFWQRWQKENPDQQELLEEARRTVLLHHVNESDNSENAKKFPVTNVNRVTHQSRGRRFGAKGKPKGEARILIGIVIAISLLLAIAFFLGNASGD